MTDRWVNIYRMNTLDKGIVHILDGMEWGGMKFHSTT